MTAIMASSSGLSDLSFDITAERFAAHLSSHLRRYLPEFCPERTSVRTLPVIGRKVSMLFEFEVTDGWRRETILYKVPSLPASCTSGLSREEKRPRLFSPIDPMTNGLREYLALKSLQKHFSALNDPRFGVVQVLDLLETPFVIVMKKHMDVSVRRLMRKATRFHRRQGKDRLNRVFSNCGAWLREFHRMPPSSHAENRHAERNSYCEAVREFTLALQQQLEPALFFRDLARDLQSAAKRVLPKQLPRATVHGDFAPRNILAGEHGRVTVLDTQRRWSAPIYEDIAYLLMSIKLPAPQVNAQGCLFSNKRLAEWASCFLRNYFDPEPVPHAAVRLYEVLLTLEWWAAINVRHRGGSLINRACLGLSNRYLFRYVEQMTREIKS